MENDPTRRLLLPQRPPSAAHLSARRRLLPPRAPSATRFSTLGSSGFGSGNGYRLPPSPLGPRGRGGVRVGGSSGHASSFSQPSSSSSAQGSPPRSNLDADLILAASVATPRRILSPLPPNHPPAAECTDLVDDDDVDDPDGTEELHAHLAGGPLAPSPADSRQNVAKRSSSVDNSGRKEKLPLPSPGTGAAALFEYANGMFSEARMKTIMADERIVELMLTDPTRAKRLLRNRKSAAKTKDLKARRISELERSFQKLKTKASILSARLTLLQRKSAELADQNNELQIRLQSAEKIARMKDALYEGLSIEIQVLKRLTTDEISDSQMPNGLPNASIAAATNTGETITAPANSGKKTSRTVQRPTTMMEPLE